MYATSDTLSYAGIASESSSHSLIQVSEPVTSDVILGDVDGNGKVDATDASQILQEYASLSTYNPSAFSAAQFTAADVDRDGNISASDASIVLKFYSFISTGGSGTLEAYMGY